MANYVLNTADLDFLNKRNQAMYKGMTNYAEPTTEPKKDTNVGGFAGGIGYLGQKIGLGALQSIEGIVDYTAGGIAKLFGNDEYAEQLFSSDWTNYNAADEWFNPEGGWKTSGDVAGGIGSSLPAMAGVAAGTAIILASGGTLTPVGSKLIIGSISASIAGLGAAGTSTKEAYRESGKLTGKEFGYGALSGITEAGIEVATAGIGKGSGRIVSSLAKTASKEAAESTAKTVSKTVAKTGAKKFFTEMGEDFVSEAFEEGFSEFISPYYQRITYNPDAENATLDEIGYAALIGGLSGAVMNGGSKAIGASYNTVDNLISGTKSVNNGTQKGIMQMAEGFAKRESASPTEIEAIQEVKEAYDKLTQSLKETNGITDDAELKSRLQSNSLTFNAKEKMLLGKLNRANTIATINPYVSNGAIALVLDSENAVQKYSAFGIKDANGNAINITEKDILSGMSPDLVAKAKAGTLTKKETAELNKELRNALKTNSVLATLAAAEATGELMVNSKKMTDSFLGGNVMLNANDLNNLIETAKPQEKKALSEALGVDNIDAISIDEFNSRLTDFRDSGKASAYRDQVNRIKEAIKRGDDNAKPLPKVLSKNLADGVYRYKKDGVDLSVFKEGDDFYVYDYSESDLSRKMTATEMNKLLNNSWKEETNPSRDIDEYARKEIDGYTSLNAPNQAAVRMTIRQAREYGLTDSQIKTYATVVAKSGLNIVFTTTIGDGYLLGNTIYANPKISETRTYEMLLGHEMFHKIFASGSKKAFKLYKSAKRFVDKAKATEIETEYTNFYKKFNKTVDNALLEEEIAAAGSEEVFKSEEAWKYILGEEPTIGDKVLSFFGKSEKDYSSVKGLSSQARKYLRQYKKLFDSISALNRGNNAFSLAMEGTNARTPVANLTADSIKMNMTPEEAKMSGKIDDSRFSLAFAKDIAKSQKEYVEKGNGKITAEELDKAISDTAIMVDKMIPYADILPQDKVGKTLVKNGSYDVSVENTTVCIRTLAYNAFVDMVSEKVGRPLTQMESFLVSQKLYEIAKEPQCLYCYVSLDRKAFNEMIIRYVEQRDTAIAEYEKAGKPKIPSSFNAEWSLFKDFLAGRKPTENMWDRYTGWLKAYNNGERLVTLEDISTEAKRLEIVESNGTASAQVKDILKYAQSALWAKKQTQYVAYTDEILKLKPTVISNLNKHYGMRWYSFSDYSGAFIVENMQQITDAAIRGLKGLSYTKDTDFAEIFAPTGMNINISVYAKKTENGYEIDPKQSADINKAIDLRKKYPNVGIVVVATDTAGVEWAMSQEWSDVVIPFHTVRTGADVAEFYDWETFNTEQSDVVSDQNLWDAYVNRLGKKKVSKMVYPSEHQNNKATYLSICKERGLTPRFKSFLDNPNYMKLVNETRQSEGETSPLKAKFDVKAAERSFNKFVEKGGYYEGWYNDGIDVDSEAEIVASDVRSGKKANEVEYGRQDIDFKDFKRNKNRTHGTISSDSDKKRYAIKFLSEDDLPSYLHAGNRANNYKRQAIESGKNIILTTQDEIHEYIKKAIDGEKDLPVVAYGKVDVRLSEETTNYSNGSIKISDYYMELVATDIYHAYIGHAKAKEEGDIDLSINDFMNIPNYVATYDDLVYAIKYKSGNTKICISKKIADGRVLVIETVSKSHGSIEFKNMIGVSEEKYSKEYEKRYKKRNGMNTGGSNSSNISPHDITDSNVIISKNSEKSNTFFENSSKNLSKGRLALPKTDSNGNALTDAQRDYFADSKAVDKNGNLLALYHGTPNENGDFYVFDYGKAKRKGGFGLASLGKGFYFTTNKKGAEVYTRSGGRLLTVYLDIENPYIVNGNIKEQISKDFDIDPLDVHHNEVQDFLKSKGYDGILTENETALLAVAFSSEQIKLTSNKNPTLNPDIRFALPKSPITNDIAYGSVERIKKPTLKEQAEAIVSGTVPGITATEIQLTNAQAGIEYAGRQLGMKNIESLVQRARASRSMAQEMIGGNQYEILPGDTLDDVKLLGKGLEPILSQIRDRRNGETKEQAEERYTAYQYYLYHKHTEDRMSLKERSEKAHEPELKKAEAIKKENKEHNKNIKALEKSLDEFAKKNAKLIITKDTEAIKKLDEYKKKIKAIKKLIKENNKELDRINSFTPEENKPVLRKLNEKDEYVPVTAEESRKAIAEYEKQYPEFKEASEELYAFLNNLLELQVQYGLITKDTYELLKKKYPHYVPTFRTEHKLGTAPIRGKGNVEVAQTVKKATGSIETLEDLELSISRMVEKVIRVGNINVLANKLYDAANGDTRFIKEISKEKTKENLFETEEVKEQPKKNQISFYRDGEKITIAVTPEIFAGFDDFNAKEDALILPIRAVSSLTNGFKTLVTSANPIFLVRNMIRDLQDAGINSKYARAFVKSYAKAIYHLSNNTELAQIYRAAGGFQSSIFDYSRGFTGKQSKMGFTNSTKKHKWLLNKIENANMFIEQLPRFAEFISSVEAGVSVDQAILNAADVTTNFGRSGKLTRKLNQTIIPFLNPSVQGLSKIYRNIKDAFKSRRAFTSLLIKCVILGVIPMVFNNLLYSDDEEYDDIKDTDKENNYLFKVGSTWIKIPKGRFVSVLAGLANRTEAEIEGRDADWKEYFGNVVSQVTPVENVTRPIWSPITDLSNNKTWYGSAIEGQQFENKRPSERYDESTSEIAKWIGKKINYSPKKIHYLLDQYSGVIGDFVLPATTQKAEKNFAVSSFIFDPVVSNKLSNDFYKLYDEAQYNKSDGDSTAKYQLKYLNEVKKSVGDMYDEISEIQKSDLSNAEKLQQTRVIRMLINNAYKTATTDYKLYTEAIKSTEGYFDDSNSSGTSMRYAEITHRMYGAEKAFEVYNSEVAEKMKVINSCGIDYESLYSYYFATKDVDSDYDKNGSAISGSKKKKVIAAINKLNVTTEQKLLLLCMKGYSLQDGDFKGMTAKTAKNKLVRYILGLKGKTKQEKTEIAKMCGFQVRNGAIVVNK